MQPRKEFKPEGAGKVQGWVHLPQLKEPIMHAAGKPIGNCFPPSLLKQLEPQAKGFCTKVPIV